MTRLSTRILLSVFALLAVAAPAPAALPDLEAVDPRRPRVEDLTHGGKHLRALRFQGYIYNAGTGAAEVRASGNSNGEMQTVVQRMFEPTMDVAMEEAVVRYENSDGHQHWHLHRAARYSLWNSAGTGQVAPAQKVGFCLTDSSNPTTGQGAEDGVYDSVCSWGHPEVASTYMGLSPGWRDVYPRDLWYQWVDISNVAPGTYRLAAEVDTDDLVDESDEVNVMEDRPVTVPGWIANPVETPVVETGGPTAVTLDADPVAETRDGDEHQNHLYPPMQPSSAEFKIVDPPEHGTLDRPTGQWFSSASLEYTPGPAGPYADSFAYVVREAGSPFPLSPPRTAVTLTGPPPPAPPEDPPPDDEEPSEEAPPAAAPPAGAPPSAQPPPAAFERVAISGAPARMVARTSVPLTATVVDSASTRVRWSATAGRIGDDGVFTAPATPGTVTVRATAAGGAFAETAIRIVAAPLREPLPTACGRSGRASARTPLGRVCARWVRGAVQVSAVPAHAGRLRVVLWRGRSPVKRCRWRATKGRTYGCRFRVRRSQRLAATVTLRRSGGRVLATRVAVR